MKQWRNLKSIQENWRNKYIIIEIIENWWYCWLIISSSHLSRIHHYLEVGVSHMNPVFFCNLLYIVSPSFLGSSYSPLSISWPAHHHLSSCTFLSTSLSFVFLWSSSFQILSHRLFLSLIHFIALYANWTLHIYVRVTVLVICEGSP